MMEERRSTLYKYRARLADFVFSNDCLIEAMLGLFWRLWRVIPKLEPYELVDDNWGEYNQERLIYIRELKHQTH